MKKILFFLFYFFYILNSETNFLGENLIEYEKFKGEKLLHYWEIKKSEGVSILWDNNIKLSKDGSICILIEKNNSYATLYSPFFSVDENKKYFFSTSYKQSWESKGYDRYIGIDSYVAIEWYDNNKNLISRGNISRFLYSETDWDIRDAILTSPLNSKFFRVKIQISNNSEKVLGKFIISKLWIDNMQLREYIPPSSEFDKDDFITDIERFQSSFPITLFFPAIDEGFKGKGSKWCKVFDDRDAMKGKTIYIPEVGEKGLVFHSPYFPSLPSGLYRFKIRAKINVKKENVNMGFVDIASQFSGTRLLINFNTSNFDKEKKYITFSDDFIIRDPGWWCIRVYTEGKIEWYIDNIIIIPLLNFSDKDLIEIYPNIEGFVDENLYPRKEKPLKILAFTGLLYKDYDDVLKELGEVKRIYFQVLMNTPTFDKFPDDVKDFFDNNIIFLNDVSIKAIPLRYKNYIKEYLKRGGNLIITIGHQSYEKSGWKNSFLEEILPFEIEGNIEFFKEGLFLKKNLEASFLENIKFNENISVYYIYKIKKVKPNCKVYIKAGDFPFLIIGEYFKGKVICFLGANLGEKVKNEIPFWECKYLITDLIKFLTGR
ncbi:MAG: hypothetical protein NC827_00670 [Candidatus Omnitrophica bacterium]|nr:hypothetical protein [Candidatus Omnitrophota bacterium]